MSHMLIYLELTIITKKSKQKTHIAYNNYYYVLSIVNVYLKYLILRSLETLERN